MMKLLANDKQLLQAIYDTSSVGIFLVDRQGRIVHANRCMTELFHCSMADLIGCEYVSLVHPLEREVGRERLSALMARQVTVLDLERLYRRWDGGQFWGHFTGKALVDARGQTTGVVGNIADIDRAKQIEWELSASQERFERLARTVPCVLYDYMMSREGERAFLYLSPRCEDFFELSATVLLADVDAFRRLVHPHDLPRLQEEERRVCDTGELFGVEVRIVTPSGKKKWIRLAARPNVVEPGISAVWSGFMLDITETKALEEELRRLATTDALTGLSNRSHFLRQAQQEMARLARVPRETGVLMLDLDYFKNINDTYGHRVGDTVLQHFARQVSGELRRIDLFGRLGGEEFCILVPETDVAGIRALGERLCRVVAEAPCPAEGQCLSYTVSIGATGILPGESSFDAVLARADDALYQAKRRGRNQVAVIQG